MIQCERNVKQCVLNCLSPNPRLWSSSLQFHNRANCPGGNCEETNKINPLYPTEKIEWLLDQKSETFKTFFGSVTEPLKIQSITTRFGNDDGNLCRVRKSSPHQPKEMINILGIKRVIVNTPKYKQTISYEICA